jgi:hypothetical protein
MFLNASIRVGMRVCSSHRALQRCLQPPLHSSMRCMLHEAASATKDTDSMEMDSKQDCTRGGGAVPLAAAPAFTSDAEMKEIPAAAAATGQLHTR